MIILDCEQGTKEWFDARCGIPTASCFDKIITSTGAKSKQFQSYQNMLAGESIVGAQESYKSEAMQRGNDLEPDAITMFEFMTDLDVQRVGLCYKDEERAASCSPDGLIGDDSGVEIKCPTLATHVGYVRANKLPAKYVPQVQGSMYITGRKSWYFMSYFPRLKPLLIEVKRDPEFCATLSKYLTEFNESLSDIKEQLK